MKPELSQKTANPIDFRQKTRILSGMQQEVVALVEFGGSHDECLLTQMEALRQAGIPIVLVTNRRLFERNPHWHAFCRSACFVEPTGKAIGDVVLMRGVVKFLKQQQVTKVVFNTAQGGHIRNLSFLLPRSVKAYGIIHTVRKFQGSFTQKRIHRMIKRYAVLSDDLLQHVSPPPGIHVCSFYPIDFPSFDQPMEKPAGEIWLTVTGGVESRRKDLSSVVGILRTTPANVRLIFLGKTDVDREDVARFLHELDEQQLRDRVLLFTGFVDHATFDQYLRHTDFLVPLIHPGTPSADEYINHQISGAFTLAFGYRIPLLIHREYCSEADLQLSAHFYTPETFSTELETAIRERATLVQQIATTEKWQKTFQYQRYLELLELD